MTVAKDKLYVLQAGRCCYCEQVMLLVGSMPFRTFARLYKISAAQVKWRVATMEHVRRKAEGGTKRRENVALACLRCNSQRGDKPWVLYKSERLRERAALALVAT